MKAIFCETTLDISLLLTPQEAAGSKRKKDCAPALEAESKGLIFHLIGTKSKEYLKVIEPSGDYNHYWISISDLAYEDLIKSNRCGTIYGNSSKISISVEDGL